MVSRKRAQADGVPAYIVFHDAPSSRSPNANARAGADLAAISGVGPSKLERYADEELAIVVAE